jgi:hypothetical protein
MDRGTNLLQGRLCVDPNRDNGGRRHVHRVDAVVHRPHLANTLHLIAHGAGQQQETGLTTD